MTRFAALLLLLIPASAYGAAGGGSSGFGGGGGGGGGGFSGGGGSSGGGFGGSGSGGTSGPWWVFPLIIGAIVIFVFGAGFVASMKYRARKRARVATVRHHAAEAAEDDAAFDHAHVSDTASQLFEECQVAWDARDHEKLQHLVSPEIWKEWKLRLDDFASKGWHNRVKVTSDPQVEYVGLINRTADREDRAVVRIEATLDDWVVDRNGHALMKSGDTDRSTTLCEYWTLAKREDGSWYVHSTEQQAEGDHHLEGEIVARPDADEQKLRGDSVMELAASDKPLEGFKTADLIDFDFDGDARAQALDLSLADPRFGPDVLETAVRRAVAAWSEAVDGEDAPLEALASAAAVTELLYPGDDSHARRLVVRGPRVDQVRIAAIDGNADPAEMAVDVTVTGRRYIQDRATAAVLAGSQDSETTFTERWTLSLSGPDANPWQLAAARAPAAQ
ncbi:MAG: TIM44-like domain-containing protein [Thermoleophilaceae bacterium]|nr:TIM44-like domain-containing protein [Thermoleophilaceae bacterium]